MYQLGCNLVCVEGTIFVFHMICLDRLLRAPTIGAPSWAIHQQPTHVPPRCTNPIQGVQLGMFEVRTIFVFHMICPDYMFARPNHRAPSWAIHQQPTHVPPTVHESIGVPFAWLVGLIACLHMIYPDDFCAPQPSRTIMASPNNQPMSHHGARINWGATLVCVEGTIFVFHMSCRMIFARPNHRAPSWAIHQQPTHVPPRCTNQLGCNFGMLKGHVLSFT
jgi:hypothetical protein